MTLKEMQSCAIETLEYFIQVMPNVPFGADDIHIEFAAKSKMAERFKVLCNEYSPGRAINEHQEYAIENYNFGIAIIGSGKSAVILRVDHKLAMHNLRRCVFHELMHIYCGKTEMDGEHFIDIYGSGHTPDPDPEDKIYDGYLNAGYFIWSEFVAEYTATMKTAPEQHSFVDITELVFSLIDEIDFNNNESKYSFAMMCAYLISCDDIGDILAGIRSPGNIIPENETDGLESMRALRVCLVLLYKHMHAEKPYKITEEYIAELGVRYLEFLLRNSIYLGALSIIDMK